MTGTIQKPILRGLVKADIVRTTIIACLTSCLVGWSYKHFIADPRKKAHIDFYKNYNAEAEADRLYKMGLIRSYRDNDDQPEEKFQLPY